MRRMHHILLPLLAALPARAEPPAPQAVAPLVARVTEAFFQAVADQDQDLQRAFFAPDLARIATPERWSEQRALIEARIGQPLAYTPHKVTWYPQNNLYVAVDFSTEIEPDTTFVCGTVIWELPTTATIGLVRLEENIVETDILENLSQEARAQTLTNWFCPPAIIEKLLALPKP